MFYFITIIILSSLQHPSEVFETDFPKEIFSWGIIKVDLKAIPAPEDNPITEAKIQLGRKLFFDPILSNSNTMNCAVCHDPQKGFSDCLPKSIGDNGRVGSRRSPTISGLAWNSNVYWDGRASSLEEQVLSVKSMNQDITTWPVELMTAGYLPLFQKAFGATDSVITVSNISKAIATYERTLISHDSPFDRFVGGDSAALDASQKRGLVLFATKAKCTLCHNGPQFTDGGFHDIGIAGDDVGRFAKIALPTLKNAFKTPGLRDVAKRAPYMHNGSVATLEDVVALYNEGGRVKDRKISSDIKPLGLTDSDQADLVAFLKALSGKVNY